MPLTRRDLLRNLGLASLAPTLLAPAPQPQPTKAWELVAAKKPWTDLPEGERVSFLSLLRELGLDGDKVRAITRMENMMAYRVEWYHQNSEGRAHTVAMCDRVPQLVRESDWAISPMGGNHNDVCMMVAHIADIDFARALDRWYSHSHLGT